MLDDYGENDLNDRNDEKHDTKLSIDDLSD